MLDWISKRVWITSLSRSVVGFRVDIMYRECEDRPSSESSSIGAIMSGGGCCIVVAEKRNYGWMQVRKFGASTWSLR